MIRVVGVALVLALLLVSPSTVHAQNGSSWGVSAGFVPKWDTSGFTKDLDKLVFDEDYVGLSGSEFRIGLIRGRRLSGDWGVSFVRRTIDDAGSDAITQGSGCQGGNSAPGAPFVLNCDAITAELRPRDLQITGVEVHKFFAFVTIAQRVQVGLNIAGGVGKGKGFYEGPEFRETFSCTFPPGRFPNFEFDADPCEGLPRTNQTRVQTGSLSEPFERLLNYDRNLVPLGKLEIAAAVIVAPQFKVRVSGGMNYPGSSTFGATGLFFFGAD